MKRLLVFSSILLLGGVVSCVSESDLQALRADVMALERQRASRERDIEQRVQTVQEQLTRLEQSQGDVRREMAQAISTAQELRVEIQRLRGEVQESRHRLRRDPSPQARDAMATKLAELETRVNSLEGRASPEGGSVVAPPRPSATPESPPSSTAPTQPPAPTPPTRPLTAVRPPPAAGPPPASSTSESDEADRLYKRALQEYQQNNHEVAIVLFKQYLRQYPKASLAGNAQYWIGESLYAQKQFEAAIVAFDEVIRKYPEDNKVPASLLKQGYAFAELKDVRNARFFLQQVQQKYPNSPEAQQAGEKLKQLQRQG